MPDMALCNIQFSSDNSLQKMTSATVILPEKMNGPFPVLYLLHGLSDDHTAWIRRTSLERYMSGLPLIIVMPNGERGWYSDALKIPNSNFESLIMTDLMGFVDTMFDTKASREGRMIAGLSMGGYGAVKLALKHPDKFCAAIGFSSAFLFDKVLDPNDPSYEEFTLIFGDNPSEGPDNVMTLIEKVDSAVRPALRIDCGTEDFLIENNRLFHQKLISLGIDHEYLERPGTHEWAYWDSGILGSLPFMKKQLGIE